MEKLSTLELLHYLSPESTEYRGAGEGQVRLTADNPSKSTFCSHYKERNAVNRPGTNKSCQRNCGLNMLS